MQLVDPVFTGLTLGETSEYLVETVLQWNATGETLIITTGHTGVKQEK